MQTCFDIFFIIFFFFIIIVTGLNSYYKCNLVSLATNKFFIDIEKSDFPKLLKEGKI